jgi:hypothetical protein
MYVSCGAICCLCPYPSTSTGSGSESVVEVTPARRPKKKRRRLNASLLALVDDQADQSGSGHEDDYGGDSLSQGYDRYVL